MSPAMQFFACSCFGATQDEEPKPSIFAQVIRRKSQIPESTEENEEQSLKVIENKLNQVKSRMRWIFREKNLSKQYSLYILYYTIYKSFRSRRDSHEFLTKELGPKLSGLKNESWWGVVGF